ncbi:substrate-binding domain-containing protein [Gracilibacillus sp. D59]|uniref:substrate-binding domain-containing protein n=1 Tax=Gracilibacillus sp. D59 TaxID=3457434 RepID=UPI003FCDEDB3
MQVAKELQEKYPDIGGVFSVDLVAIAFLREAMKKGINVPKLLQLVGYDGSFVSHMTYPSFPSVVQPYEGLAQQAVSVLYQLMNKGTLAS